MYVARYTNNPEGDIERGWSGFMGMQWASALEWLKDNTQFSEGFGIDADGGDLEERQQRWVNTYGDEYEDLDTFINAYAEEAAEENGIIFDATLNLWRAFHHDGLSCWALDAETDAEAIAEAKTKAESGEISWCGFGQATVGDVKLVAKVEGITEPLYVFECDDVEEEA